MLADYQQLEDDLVRDQAGVIDADARDRAIAGAVVQYGADVPRRLTLSVMWPADGTMGVVPDGWVDGTRVVDAECPHGTPVTVVAVRVPDGWALQSTQPLPAGATVWLTCSAPHVVSDTEDTVGAVHRTPVAMLAASVLCLQLATHYSAQRETAIGADASATETRAREYAARAMEYRSAYYVGTGQNDPFKSSASSGSGVAPAAAIGAWPARRRAILIKRGL